MSFDLKIKNGDLIIDKTGVIEPVIGNSKLKQDILKILLTDVGDNKYHKRYGSMLGKIRVGSITDEKIIKLDLEKSVRNALNNLMSLQRSQAKRQTLSSGEIISKVLNISIFRDDSDPRAYNIMVSVLTGEITEVTTSLAVKIA